MKRWHASGGKSPGVGAPSARVIASKGRKARYAIRFYDHCEPDVRERVGAGIARIDARPHRDPVWKATDYRAMPTEAQRLAAAGRVLAFLVSAVDPSEECGESPDKGPHVPMADGRCSLCDRTLATTEPEPVAVQADEPESEIAPAWRCKTCTREGRGEAPAQCPECTSERDANHGPHARAPAVATGKPRRKRAPRVKPSAVSVRAAIVVASAMAERVERTGTTEPDRHEPPTPEPVVYTGPVLVPDLEPPPRPEWRCQTCTREGYGGPPQHCPGCTSERDDRHGPAPTSVPARPFRGAGAYSRRAS